MDARPPSADDVRTVTSGLEHEAARHADGQAHVTAVPAAFPDAAGEDLIAADEVPIRTS